MLSSWGAPQASADVAPIDFKSRDVAPGRNFTERIVAALAVGESAGQTNYSFDLGLPAGRGVQPHLSLDYSSGGGPSEIGWGWQLSLPMIERSYAHGVPTYDDTVDTFRFRVGHSSQDLVTTGEVTPDGWAVYREETERSYSRYLRKDNRWRVLRTDGIRLELGSARASRRGNGERIASSETAAWLIERMVEPHGNEVAYAYEDRVGMQALLSVIEYTRHPGQGFLPTYHVELFWPTHFATERAVSFRKGYRESFGEVRLAAVVVTAPPMSTAGLPVTVPASSPTSRTFTVTHDTTSGDDSPYRITQIQTASAPPTVFSYAEPWSSGTSPVASIFPTVPANVDFPRHVGKTVSDDLSTRTTYVLADVTGDGRPDLVDAESRCDHDGTGGSARAWVIWRHTGSSFVPELWQSPTVPSAARTSPCAARVTYQEYDFDTHTTQELLDLTGDSLPDIVYWDAATTWICRGTGSGFDTCEEWDILPGNAPKVFRRERTGFAGSNITRTDVDLIDFNGDGYVDHVRSTTGAATTIKVVLNDRGLGWGSEHEHSLPPCHPLPPAFATDCLRLSERIVSDGSFNRRLLADVRDVNGDGLPDFMRTDVAETPVVFEVAWGTGSDFAAAQNVNIPTGNLGHGYEGSGDPDSGGGYRVGQDLVDVDGDGLVDVVELPIASPTTLRVYYNQGGSWETTPHVYPLATQPNGYLPASLGTDASSGLYALLGRGRFLDFTGDGIVDFVSPPPLSALHGGLAVQSFAYRAPRALTAATSLSGNHVSEIEYEALTGLLPFPMHVARVKRLRRSPTYPAEPTRLTAASTVYTYDDPVYDRAEREFRGYGIVVATDQGYGRVVHTSYLTGKHTSGLVESQIVSNVDADGAPTMRTVEYTEVPLGGGSTFVRQDRETQYDGELFQWRILQHRHLGYYYGRPLITYEDDDLTSSDHEVFTYREYVIRSDSNHLLIVPSRMDRRDATTLAYLHRSLTFYDDRTTPGLPPTLGDAVRSLTWSGTEWIDHNAYYDTLGRVQSYVDPEGAAVSYTYDATHEQFPVRDSSGFGDVYRSFHALSGLIADVCGPQYLGSSWRCARAHVDDLDRPTLIEVPAITNGAFHTVIAEQYEYNDATYPLKVTKTVAPGTSEQARNLTYLDGFGSAVQTRAEEAPGTFLTQDRATDARGALIWSARTRRAAGAAYVPYNDPGVDGYHFEHDYVRNSVERAFSPLEPGGGGPVPVTTTIHHGTHIVTVDEDGRTSQQVLDGFGSVVRRIQYGDPTTGDADTVFHYDGNRRLIALVDPNGLTTVWNRNLVGWVTGVIAPDLSSYSYDHDRRGAVTEQTDPRGAVVGFDYDPVGRLQRTYSATKPPDGVPAVDETITYHDALTSTAELNWRATIEADRITQSFDYDAGGRVSRFTSWSADHGGDKATVSFDYTPLGRLAAVLYGEHWGVTYGYYLDGGQKEVRDRDTQALLAELERDIHGRTHLIASPHGYVNTALYDARDRVRRMVSQDLAVAGDALVDDAFTWSQAGVLLQVIRDGAPPGQVVSPAPRVYDIVHDALGRLQTVEIDQQPWASYDYDVGSRQTIFQEGPTAFDYTYAADKVTQRSSALGGHQQIYDHDAAGNVVATMLSDGGGPLRGATMSWDALGRLSSVVPFPAAPNPGETRYKYVGGTLALIEGVGPDTTGGTILNLGEWARYDVDTATYTDRLMLGGVLLGERRNGTLEWIHRTLGSTVAAVSDTSGAVLRQEEFFPYGAAATSSGNASHEAGFHGLRRDSFIVAGPRGYEAGSGRWFARDPLLRLDPETFAAMLHHDAFGYAHADPFGFRDPSGLEPILISGVSGEMGRAALFTFNPAYAAYEMRHSFGDILLTIPCMGPCNTANAPTSPDSPTYASTTPGEILLSAGLLIGGSWVSQVLFKAGVAAPFGVATVSTGGKPPRGSNNANTRRASARGSSLHADRPGMLPEQLRARYPDTEFEFTKHGVAGQDVKVVGGVHPSAYPDSKWPAGVHKADFKPGNRSGWLRFMRDMVVKWNNEKTHYLPYDPATGALQ